MRFEYDIKYTDVFFPTYLPILWEPLVSQSRYKILMFGQRLASLNQSLVFKTQLYIVTKIGFARYKRLL
jgi:hypothetical protein